MSGTELRRAIETWVAHALSRLNVDSPDLLPSCPRCGRSTVLSLGRAHSSLEWMRCLDCSYVWAFDPGRRAGVGRGRDAVPGRGVSPEAGSG